MLYAKQPIDQDGTWPALYCAKDYIQEHELFLVVNCDDIFDKEELEKIIASKAIGMGVTTTTMPAKYHGILTTTDRIVDGFRRHVDVEREELVDDVFANGLFLLDSNVFSFASVPLADNEHGLPQTLLAHKETYPLVAHEMKQWNPCNSLEDLQKIHE